MCTIMLGHNTHTVIISPKSNFTGNSVQFYVSPTDITQLLQQVIKKLRNLAPEQ